MSKKLITAETIREIKAKGQTQVEVDFANCIITPEAKEVAEQLGVAIVCQGDIGAATKPQQASVSGNTASLSAVELKAVRQAVIDKLPKGVMVSDTLIDQLVCRTIKEGNQPVAAKNTLAQKKTSGIKVVKGSATALDIFEGAGKEKRVGIADVITTDDNSSMAAGYMAWENAFFPWTLNYDEVDVILEGELHIRCQGETTIGKAGDIMFIPKGSTIEFGTPSKVRFVYVAWPANWQEQ